MVYRLANVYTALFGAVGVFSFGLAAVALRHRSNRVAWPLSAFMIAVGVWSLGDALRIAAPTRAHILFWNHVAYAGIVTVLPTFVTLVLAFTNRETWLQRRYLVGLFGVSAVTYVLVLTNPAGLWRLGETIVPHSDPPVLEEERGPLWFAFVTYVFSVVVLMLYLLGREFLQRNQSRVYRDQLGLLLAAFSVATAVTTLYVLGVLPFDLSPLGFAVMGLLLTVAVFRYQLLEITPIARDVVLDSIDSGVLVLRPDETIVDANDRARQILQHGDTLRGETVSAVVPDDVVVDDPFDRGPAGSDTITVETDGGCSHYDVDLSPIEDSFGTYLGDVVIFNDVTDQVDRREELRRRTRQLERRNERLDQFASVVSHDLRNPLQVAAGSVELSRELDDEDQLDRAERAIERMESIVDDLLTLSRIGNEIGDTEPVDLRTVAVEARHHVDIGRSSVDIAADLPTVDADHDALLHVFENLFRNAIDHNDEPVTVSVSPIVSDGDTVGFAVADDGVGIPESEREEVLEHGYSTDQSGTGFGLSIVRDVVEAHGWTIGVRESDEGGARFEVLVT